ncbi:hypothetical protein CYMTET_49894 [Cymbomonas tetramitiformis]|uniref:tRNA (guanine-N(7)-)-methyltransferase n=1 Tax=Cymbomonas tetramitiformis TaxID=36881 RepID=A0AAE0BPD5_9CHLO|nr:hypothetical protein CYMTET_49894 [Cymbomonas tetramitiformis]
MGREKRAASAMDAPDRDPSHRQSDGMPQKRFYRARAHSNPLNDCQFPVPVSPVEQDWAEHFPAFFPSDPSVAPLADDAKVRMVDVGCGFGGLLMQLSPLFPKDLMVGMELRDKVSEYVKERILASRKNHPGEFENVSCLRTNAMKYLPNYFEKGQLTKLFFLFPDPHFKAANHRRRIVTRTLLAEYAHFLQVGGTLYTVTDVPELGDWMSEACDNHPLFERLTQEELDVDPCIPLLTTATEEGQKVARNEGVRCMNVFRRISPEGL